MTSGPAPRLQTSWDWRAAGNFMAGGAGSGLIVFAALSRAGTGTLAVQMLAGVALVALGLFCVWLEIGRPLRALNVFFNPRRSWMSREAFVAALLLPAGLAAAAGLPGARWVAALLALAFVVCQSRILQAARGIPTWREPLVVPLVILTGLAEGAGLHLIMQPLASEREALLGVAFIALVLARGLVWFAYRQRVEAVAPARARAALDGAGGLLLLVGAVLPLALALPVFAALADGVAGAAFLAIAGLAAAATGAWLKFTLVTRAAFHQGFALAHLPVRGARR